MMRNQMRQQQMHMRQGSNSSGHSGSPAMAHASPIMTPISPSMQYASPGMAAQMPSINMQGQRPPSRSATPQTQMQRMGSSGSVPGVPGVQSPSQGMAQGSPRGMQAGVAR
jgi:chromatin modification-related protein VID21